MKRWYLAVAVAGLWPVAELRAQEGLAPTAPVVPAPVLKNGNVLAPSDGNGWGSNPRMFSVAKWSPFRNPATASTVEPASGATAPTAVGRSERPDFGREVRPRELRTGGVRARGARPFVLGAH
jgi:hypothetical protein